MDKKYIIGIDQSTQGTKALLFDETGVPIARCDKPHHQMIHDKGWVEHDPVEIYRNTLEVVQKLLQQTGVDQRELAGIGISNQRETVVVWDACTGEPIYPAIVWQCARGKPICDRIREAGGDKLIQEHTGLPLSPYFSAAKIAWILEHVEGAAGKAKAGQLCIGTMDSWLVYQLTQGREFATDYSNASRTQLFHITDLAWDEEVCTMFGIPTQCLPAVKDSNGAYGMTDFAGLLTEPLPIHAAIGDSHGALFGQGCLHPGMLKTTYGTGSSIMMNVGEKPIFSKHGLATSIAWGLDGKVTYVLEGNINYTGAVISWLEQDLKLIASASATEQLAREANPEDTAYLVPAFTGLGAPYWDAHASGIISGITRTTGQKELVKASLECIAYQITDILEAMSLDSGIPIEKICVDGGPTRNKYLMQFQSDMARVPVQVPQVEELSGCGAAFAAGLALRLYRQDTLFRKRENVLLQPSMELDTRNKKYAGWKHAVKLALTK